MGEIISIAQVQITPDSRVQYLGSRTSCRYCGDTDPKAFGRKKNAHTFPAALGNHTLFSLDECKACNSIFSKYEDSIVKAVGPFLTLGGVKGKGSVRQTGSSNSPYTIRHGRDERGRRLSVRSVGTSDSVSTDHLGNSIVTMPVHGDRLIPIHAYKALLKMGLSLLPEEHIPNFNYAFEALQKPDNDLNSKKLLVGMSFSNIGNFLPAIAGQLFMCRHETVSESPYMIFIFVAGSVCFQTAIFPDKAKNLFDGGVESRIKWTSKFPKPEGGFLSVGYCQPHQLNWSSKELELQPIEAFTLKYNSSTTAGELTPTFR